MKQRGKGGAALCTPPHRHGKSRMCMREVGGGKAEERGGRSGTLQLLVCSVFGSAVDACAAVVAVACHTWLPRQHGAAVPPTRPHLEAWRGFERVCERRCAVVSDAVVAEILVASAAAAVRMGMIRPRQPRNTHRPEPNLFPLFPHLPDVAAATSASPTSSLFLF
eukprot:353279-Chlamydomonas_euryale.AAC.1